MGERIKDTKNEQGLNDVAGKDGETFKLLIETRRWSVTSPGESLGHIRSRVPLFHRAPTGQPAGPPDAETL